MPMTRSPPCALLQRSKSSCPRASLRNSLTSTMRPSSSSAAAASELLWESIPIATPIPASFPRPIYDVTSGRTTRRWGKHPSIESLPLVRSRPEGRSGQKSAVCDMHFGVTSGRLPETLRERKSPRPDSHACSFGVRGTILRGFDFFVGEKCAEGGAGDCASFSYLETFFRFFRRKRTTWFLTTFSLTRYERRKKSPHTHTLEPLLWSRREFSESRSEFSEGRRHGRNNMIGIVEV